MECKAINELLAGYLDGELTSTEKQQVETHLASCPACQKELDALSTMRDELQEAFKLRASEIHPSPQAWEKVRQRIAAEPRPGFWERLGGAMRNPVWQAVTPVILLLVVVVALWQSGTLSSWVGSEKSTLKHAPGLGSTYNAENGTAGGGSTMASTTTIAIPRVTTTAVIAAVPSSPINDQSLAAASGKGSSTTTVTPTTTTIPVPTTTAITTITMEMTTAPTLPVPAISGTIYTIPGETISTTVGSSFWITLPETSAQITWRVGQFDSNILSFTQSIVFTFIPDNQWSGRQYFQFQANATGTTSVEFVMDSSTGTTVSPVVFNVIVD